LIEIIVRQLLSYISHVIGGIASLIIIWGVFVAMKGFIVNEMTKDLHGEDAQMERRDIRQKLGGHLLLGLEVLIAADIIETIANPTLNEVIRLASIVIIRTFISYFLDKELKENV
jgi:uncharacterized membrane protein